MTRRRFVRGATLAAAGLALHPAWAEASENRLRVALLSDTHIPADRENQYRGFFPVRNLEEAIPAVVGTRPELAIICGDAARLTGELEDYEALKKLLLPLGEVAPVCIGLGNHDNRGHFFKVFNQAPVGAQEVTGKHVAVVERSEVRLIVLDSLLYVDRVAGLLGKAQRQWLAGFLDQADDRPTVLLVHHTLGDGDGDLLDADRLFDLIQSHRQVKAIFFGHSHVWGITRREGVQLVNLPAVGYNFRDQDPVGWVEAEFNAGGVELVLHAMAGNREEDGSRRFVRWE
jgi:3',5'-cyclic AMP phosphodiesterase CpdA